VKLSLIVAAARSFSLLAAVPSTRLAARLWRARQVAPARVGRTVVAKDEATCHALRVIDGNGVAPAATAPPSTGLDPSELPSAYKLIGLKSGGSAVAIADRLRLHQPRERPTRLPQAVRPRRLHPAPAAALGSSTRTAAPASADGRRLGAGAGPRRRRRLGSMPRLSNRRPPGQERVVREPRHRPSVAHDGNVVARSAQ
jgi:hypothetical protein